MVGKQCDKKADLAVRPRSITGLFEPMISQEMNNDLCKEFTEEEISNTMFQIGPLKAPGPNGFPACFFQRNWEVLRKDVIAVVKNFFDTDVMPQGVNEMVIVLLPKKEDPEGLKDFKPISLCNVVYKVVSKCMVNRLCPLLHDIISLEQSAFIPGRLIIDNTLIAFECLHAMNHGNNSCKSFGVLKLDLTKVYDRVE
jgi:hypothetical protein